MRCQQSPGTLSHYTEWATVWEVKTCRTLSPGEGPALEPGDSAGTKMACEPVLQLFWQAIRAVEAATEYTPLPDNAASPFRPPAGARASAFCWIWAQHRPAVREILTIMRRRVPRRARADLISAHTPIMLSSKGPRDCKLQGLRRDLLIDNLAKGSACGHCAECLQGPGQSSYMLLPLTDSAPAGRSIRHKWEEMQYSEA
jgi:hypothetical protein